MTCTSVCNVKVKHIRPRYENLKKWMEDPNNVYIGRKGVVCIDGKRFPEHDSPFANPFKIKDTTEGMSEEEAKEDVIERYRTYIKDKIDSKEVDLEQLRGKNCGCWCRPLRCHGEVLLELLHN